MLFLFINGLRSINKKWVQFFGLIVLIFLSVIVFSGINQSNRELLRNFSNFIDKYWQGKKPLLNIGICKNTILLKT